MPVVLTIAAALWRVADGRGFGPTWARNVVGLAIALACAYAGAWDHFRDLTNMIVPAICAIIAWLTLILGYTNWPAWSSVARYGGPTCAIAALGYLGGANPLAAILYAFGGVYTGILYVALHRAWPFRYSTAVCEGVAGAAIVGGLAWLR